MKLLLRMFTLIFLAAIGTPALGEVLVIGVSTGYPPYYYKNNGKMSGLCVEMINAAARDLGMEIEYREYPWKRLILSAQKGDVDAIMPLFRTKEREDYLNFNGLELAYETNHFFTSQDYSVSYYGSFEGLSPFSIGVVEDYSYGEMFDGFDFPTKVVTLDDKHLIEMFMHKRFDIGVGNRYVIHHYAGLAGIAEKIRFLDPPISQEMLYLGFTRKGNKHDLAEKFAEVLKAYKSTAEYRKLIENYGVMGQ